MGLGIDLVLIYLRIFGVRLDPKGRTGGLGPVWLGIVKPIKIGVGIGISGVGVGVGDGLGIKYLRIIKIILF